MAIAIRPIRHDLFHERRDYSGEQLVSSNSTEETEFTYTFENLFHPFVGELIAKLNKESLRGLLDPNYHDRLARDVIAPADLETVSRDTNSFFLLFDEHYESADSSGRVTVEGFPRGIDVGDGGPYANYNWELLFHIPLTIAVHLSKSQRFAEAQRWFHYIFDPTSNEPVDPPKRFWRFLAFRQDHDPMQIDEQLRSLSDPTTDPTLRQRILAGYEEIRDRPFRPHAVARSRHIAYQYCVVMKYLDNLIAWGDHLFRQDSIESINEATQRYVLAANLLGDRPQRIPASGHVRPKSFKDLRERGLDPLGNARVLLEGKFPFNLGMPRNPGVDDEAGLTLFGIANTLYFCVPRNEKLLAYWDTVADRLFKIRHCMNIEGVVRPRALFDPPLDPGMLVKAAAAGIDFGSIVSGLHQPIGPIRCVVLIQKALELCSEVRALGSALLAALEKGDGERITVLRHGHDTKLQQMAQEVRFLQWKQAQESTESLLRSRSAILERYRYYLRLFGQTPDSNFAPDELPLDRRELTEENFDEAHEALVGQYEKAIGLQQLPLLKLAGDSSPGILSGFSGSGKIYLSENEDTELDVHLPLARDLRLIASAANVVAGALMPIPSVNVNVHFWGLGASSEVMSGSTLGVIAKTAGEIANIAAAWEQDQANMTARYASYERRADEWLFQCNQAALELRQIGRQVLGHLIAEQIAHHEYLNVQKQIEQSEEVTRFLEEKFTNEGLYAWMQGEILRLYYEYYRFAFDVARRAEQTMKRELMRPEVDATEYIKFNYWDGGRKGLLSGEALHLDIKRLESAYHENNKREYELTKHVSLRQLDPVALLTLKASGVCQVTVPEWLFDRDCPGHYMRRIKSVALSIPAVVGPFTGMNCTLSLLRSSVRKSSLLKDGEYRRQGSEDDRFVDYIGAVQSIVTSGASTDTGLFETNLRDERFLPFEGAGAESTWKLELPKDYPAFDHSTISDVVLHVQYTARQGVDASAVIAALAEILELPDAGLALLLDLRHEFPGEWAAFAGGGDFVATIQRDRFPYFTQGREIRIDRMEVFGVDVTSHQTVGDADAASDDLGDEQRFVLTVERGAVLAPTARSAFLVIRYTF